MLAQPEALISAAENLDAQFITGTLESRQALESATELHLEQNTGRDTKQGGLSPPLVAACKACGEVLRKHHCCIKSKGQHQMKVSDICP